MTDAVVEARELCDALRSLTSGAVHLAAVGDAIAGVQPRIVTEPEDEAEVAAVLAFADRERLAVVPRGGGTQLGLGYPPERADIVLSLARLNALVEHAAGDQTVTVRAGMPLAGLQRLLAPAGQWLALDPALPEEATVGGIIATNASGSRRMRYGGVRDQLLGVQIVLANGTLAKGGGRVVKNVAGYDLPKLFAGSLGTLGIITAATLRLYPQPRVKRLVVVSAHSLDQLCDLAAAVAATTLTPAALDIFGAPGNTTDTLLVAFETTTVAGADQQVDQLISLAHAHGLSASVMDGTSEEAHALWHVSRACMAAPPRGILLKASVVLTAVRPWLNALSAVASQHALTARWCAHAGHGIVWASLDGTDGGLVAAVAELRGRAQSDGRGSLVVQQWPAHLADRLDPWGEVPAQPLMQRIKQQFDPHRTLNPGRFVGRL